MALINFTRRNLNKFRENIFHSIMLHDNLRVITHIAAFDGWEEKCADAKMNFYGADFHCSASATCGIRSWEWHWHWCSVFYCRGWVILCREGASWKSPSHLNWQMTRTASEAYPLLSSIHPPWLIVAIMSRWRQPPTAIHNSLCDWLALTIRR